MKSTDLHTGQIYYAYGTSAWKKDVQSHPDKYPHRWWQIKLLRKKIPYTNEKGQKLANGLLAYCPFLHKEYIISPRDVRHDHQEHVRLEQKQEAYQEAYLEWQTVWRQINEMRKDKLEALFEKIGISKDPANWPSGNSHFAPSSMSTQGFYLKLDSLDFQFLLAKLGICNAPTKEMPYPMPKRPDKHYRW